MSKGIVVKINGQRCRISRAQAKALGILPKKRKERAVVLPATREQAVREFLERMHGKDLTRTRGRGKERA